MGYRKAVPRASARYALNPGLFEDWSTNDETGVGQGFELETVRPGRITSTSQTTFAPENNALLAGVELLERSGPTWFHFDMNNALADLPSIRETPPQD